MKKWKKNKIITSVCVFLMLFCFGCANVSEDEGQNEQQTETSSEMVEASEVTEVENEQQTEEFEIVEMRKEDTAGNLEVHFLDVGQGDCTLLLCDGYSMLIDAGNNDKGTYVQNYLQKQGITKLDYVIGTHPDADHIGGLDVILYKFDCDTIILPNVTNDTVTYRDVVAAMESKQYQTTYPVVGTTYELGSASFTIVAPNANYGSNLNECSVGILVQNGDNRFLFTGDAEENSEADMLRNGIDLKADVYKVAHHGSNTATTEEFLEAVGPTYAVISVGGGNSYGHPQAEVLNRLRAHGVSVFRTDEQGTLVASSDGTTITWNCSPDESWKAGENVGGSAGTEDSDTTKIQDEVEEQNDASTDMVHITATGSKYHKAGCRYLKDSDIEISYEDAIAQGYEACKVCGGH